MRVAPHANDRNAFIAGDFNFDRAGDARLILSQPHVVGAPSRGSTFWNRALRNYTEIDAGQFSRYDSCADALTCLDFVYSAAPPSLLAQLHVNFPEDFDPRTLHSKGISDHAPVGFALRTRRPQKKKSQLISAHVVNHPSFRLAHDELATAVDLDSLPVHARWFAHKTIIKAAAKLTRNALLAGDCDTPFARAQSLATVSRAVWRQDVRLTKNILIHNTIAKKTIHLVNGKPALIDPAKFEEEFARARLAMLNIEKASLTRNGGASRRRSGRLAAIARAERLWAPAAPRLILTAIRVPRKDGSTVLTSTPAAMAAALGAGWAPTFSEHKHTDIDLMVSYVSRWTARLPWHMASPPGVQDYVEFLHRARDSAPGADGLPYSAWKAAGHCGAKTLCLVGEAQLRGIAMPLEYYTVIKRFPPKGTDPDDAVTCSRSTDDTRPLALINSDRKTTAAVMNRAVSQVYSKGINKIQNGFVRGRNFVDNVVDLDGSARVHSQSAVSGLIPAAFRPGLASWDYAAAFPSLSQLYMKAVLRASGAPLGLSNLIDVFYALVFAYVKVAAETIFFFIARCGVLQGCPLSGTLFAAAADPTLCHLEATCVGANGKPRAALRACADDLGAAVEDIRVLIDLEGAFATIQRVAHLKLKPKKCWYAPVYELANALTIFDIKEWLAEFVPAWAAFEVAPALKYLGFWLGPGAGACVWSAPVAKWQKTAAAIGHSERTPAVAALAYNVRAVTTLGYVAQLARQPVNIVTDDARAAYKVVGLPPQAVRRSDLFRLDAAGGPAITSAEVLVAAARTRAAFQTLSSWRSICNMIKDENSESASIAALGSGRWWPECWDSPPYAMLAEEAFECRHLPEAAARKVRKLMGHHGARADHDVAFRAVPHFQKMVYTMVLEERHTCMIDVTLEKRRNTCFAAPWCPAAAIDWPEIRRLLKTMPPFAATACLKTFLNGWTTSSRMGEAFVPSCRFGCSAGTRHLATHSFYDHAEDRTAHYVACLPLWKLFRPRLVDAEWTPLASCGLSPPSPKDLKNVARSFYVYNIFKHSASPEHSPLAERLAAARRLAYAAVA